MLQTGRDARKERSISATARTSGFNVRVLRAVFSFVASDKSAPFCKGVMFALLSLLVPLGALLSDATSAQAATSNTLNFQGRLLNAAGDLVADGTYNVQFNLYYVSTAGTSQWTETRTNQGGNPVSIQNGYYSVYLGDTTTGGTAFPGSIDWSQDLYLGMTIRGTGSCSFAACTPNDSEMTPRFKLTAVPYALRAANVASSDTNSASSNTDGVTIETGDALGATSNSGSIGIDVGAATGTEGSINIGGVNASSINLGSGSGTFVLQTSNIDISSAGVISGATGISSSGTITFSGLNCTGNVNGGALTADALGVISCSDDDGGSGGGGSLFTDGGTFTYLTATADDFSLGATIVADGTFYVDVSAGSLRLGSTGTTDVAGALSIADTNGQTTTIVAGNSSGDITFTLPTSVGTANYCLKNSGVAGVLEFNTCTTGSGAGGAITLDDAYEAGNSIITSDNKNILFTLSDTTTDSDFIANLVGTGNTFELQDGGVSFLTAVDGGALTFQNTVNSTSALSILNSGGADTLFGADTTNNRILIGNQTGTNAATTLLVVDSATADPIGGTYIDGSIYYDSNLDVLRCRINGAWTNCDTSGSGITSFSVTGSTGSTQTITDGNTLSILAGGSGNLTSVASATDIITLDIVSNPTFSGLIPVKQA